MSSYLPIFVLALLAAALANAGQSRADGAAASPAQQPSPSAPEPPAAPLTATQLRKLAGRRLFFGHQSIGKNLLDGAGRLYGRAGETLTLAESEDPKALETSGWVHSFIGHNGDPLGKIARFEQVMDRGFGDKAEVAMLKLCYIDIDRDTDVQALFSRYQATLARLQQRYPHTTFVHVTTPLTTVGAGIKSAIKRLLGMEVWGEQANIRRAAYNALLLDTYRGKAPVFDLAALESTSEDGAPYTYVKGGVSHPALVPSYTLDGGHLTAPAQERVARGFLAFLAGLPPRS